MIAIENRAGLLCTYDTATKTFAQYVTVEDLREALRRAGVSEVGYSPDAAWKLPRAAGDASREGDFRQSASQAKPGPKSRWVMVPVDWVGDGESIEARCHNSRE